MKRRVAAIGAAILAVSLALSACSGSNESSSPAPAETSSPSASGNGNPAPADKPYWVSNEKITLKVAIPQNASVIDYATNEFTKWMEEQTNVHADFEVIPTDSTSNGLNLLLASGDYPDVYLGFGVSDNLEATYGVSQHLFLPLNDLIEKNMPNFQQVLTQYPATAGIITATDGNIYALPSINECYHCTYQQRMWINREWLEKLGLSEPKTIDELYETLKAFKDNDLNGNGKADEIPLVGAYEGGWNTNIEPWLVSAFITDPGMNNKTKVSINDGKVLTIANQPEYKEALSYIRKLYADGLIYKGSFTQKEDQMKQMLASDPPIVGAFMSGASVIDIDPNSNEQAYRRYEMLAPVVGPLGRENTPKFEYDSIQKGAFLISAQSEKADIAAKWADQFYNNDYIVQQHRSQGVEDEDWRKATADEKGLDGRPALFTGLKAYSTEAQNNAWIYVGIEYYPADYRLGQSVPQVDDLYAPSASEKLLFQETKIKYEPAASETVKPMPPVKLTVDENQELLTSSVEIDKYIEEFRVKSITTEGYLEKNWDGYLDRLNKIGLTKYLEIYQTAYDRQYANP
ncbi:extracellular solute-binding protein [Cohnella cellulosilytica]|uniref:Extracellular solute-binding protein n=1 Tax=Cohnella cellulosilytica TaxID=986710 RepID=A0ABW2FF44_9BACL